MSHDETDVEYIPVEAVADLLGVSQRQATRYAKKVRTQQDGRRILYHRADVERIAQARGTDHDRPLAIQTEVIPPGRLLDLITQQQHELARLNHDNGQLAERLRTQQERAEVAEQHQRQLVLDTDETRLQLAEAQARAKVAEAESERLRLDLERARRTWWRRFLRK